MTDTLKAVIWDFDGTLVDTEPVWASTEQEMVAEHGVIWSDEHMRAKVGQHARISAAQMAEAIGLPDEADRLYDELHERVAQHLRNDDLPYLPGVRELIHEIGEAGIRAAIVTASNGVIIDAARDRLPKLFEFIVTADDVTNNKPHPEPYLQAYERLGLAPTDCIILEDSVPGSTSALDSGGLVFGVPHAMPLPEHERLHVSTDGVASTDLAALTDVWRRLRERA